jgi:hypothetical protein
VRQNGQSECMPGAISSANEAPGTRLNYVGVGDACTVQQRRPYSGNGNGNLQHWVPDFPTWPSSLELVKMEWAGALAERG